MTPADERTEYLQTLWTEFCKLVGRDPDYCCSSAEWALFYELWQERASCPLRVFLRAVMDVREGRTEEELREPRFRNALYYRRAIIKASEMWQRAVGA